MRNINIVITGGSGFVGQYLIKTLLERGFNLFVFTRGSDKIVRGIGVTVIVVDYSDAGMLAEKLITINPQFIVHLGASRDRRHFTDMCINDIVDNINADINLITAAAHLDDLSLFVYLGTADMYAPESANTIGFDSEIAPKNIYGLKKAVGKNLVESLFKTHGFPGVCLVPSVIYGPGQAPDMFLPALISCLVRNEKFNMTDGSQHRDYIFVTDVVDAVVSLITVKNKSCLGLTVLLGSGFSISIRDLALLVASSFGENSRSLLSFGAIKSRESENSGYNFDMAKSQILLNWRAKVSIEAGIKATLDYAVRLAND
jgi:nucleoside-diphosphate-sugar epimerase